MSDFFNDNTWNYSFPLSERYKEVRAKTKKAFENNEFLQLLTGDIDYRIDNQKTGEKWGAPYPDPTDWSTVIKYGIYDLYTEIMDRQVIEMYKLSIQSLIDGTAEQIWIAFEILCIQFWNERDGKCPFSSFSMEYFTKLSQALSKNEEELKNLKKWRAVDEPDGLWKIISLRNQRFIRDYNIALLQE